VRRKHNKENKGIQANLGNTSGGKKSSKGSIFFLPKEG